MERSYCWTDWDHCSCYPHSRSLCSPLHRKEQPQGGKNACLTDSLHAEMLQVFTQTYQLSVLSKLSAQTLQKVPCPLCSGHAGSVAETTPNWAVVSSLCVMIWYVLLRFLNRMHFKISFPSREASSPRRYWWDNSSFCSRHGPLWLELLSAQGQGCGITVWVLAHTVLQFGNLGSLVESRKQDLSLGLKLDYL